MAISTKALAIGLVVGLVIGLVAGYFVAPTGVDVTALEKQISDLEKQVGTLQTQIKDKDTTISSLESQIGNLQEELQTKTNQLDELQTKLSGKDAQIADLEGQISTLQEEVNELKKLVPLYRKGEWNLIETFKGSSSMTTDYFYIAGADIRINWTWTSGVPKYAGFSFSLYKEGETIWTVFEFDLDSIGTTHVHNLKTANYYLEISEANIDEWTITVEVWIPD